MKKLLIVLSIMVVMLSACELFTVSVPDFIDEFGGNSDTSPVKTPTFDHEGEPEAFDFSKSITFKSATAGVKFYYTTNGTLPTEKSESISSSTDASGSSVATSGIMLSGTASTYTVRVIAIKGSKTSMVAERNFTRDGSIAIPEFIYSGDNTAFDFSKSITFTSATDGVKFHYTTNGTLPTEKSESISSSTDASGSSVSSSGVTFAGTAATYTIRVIAMKGNESSMVAERNFTRDGSIAIPEFIYSGDNATFDFSKKITFTSATAGVKFYYTINGTLPTEKSESISSSTDASGSSVASSGVTLPGTVATYTVKVIARKGGATSIVAERNFTRDGAVAIPEFIHKGNNADFDFVNNRITFASETPDVTFYYTTDGKDPTTRSKSIRSGAFNGGSVGTSDFLLKGSVTTYTVKVIGVNSNYTTSVIAKKNFTQEGAIAVPEFIHKGSSADFDFEDSITFASATPGVNFHYTTDGKAPTPSDEMIGSIATANGGSVGNDVFMLTGDDVTYTVKVIAVTGSKSSVAVEKTFVRKETNKTLEVTAVGGGSIRVEEAGEISGSTYTVPYGTRVTLTAKVDPGYEFTKWTGDTGDASVTNATISIMMYGDKRISTTFTKTEYTLTVTQPAPEQGSIEVKSGETVLIAPYKVKDGTKLTLTAIATKDYDFAGWTGAATGISTGTVTMDDDKTIGALFAKKTGVGQPIFDYEGENTSFDFTNEITFKSTTPNVTFQYTIRDISSNTGTSGIIESKSDGEGSVSKEGISLSDAGKYIVWVVAEKGGKSSNSASLTFTKQHTLTVTQPGVGGSIQVQGAGEMISDKTYKVAHGTKVTLTAISYDGYEFSEWEGTTGSGKTLIFEMDDDKTIGVVFTKKQYTLTVTQPPTEEGNITVEGAGTGTPTTYKVEHGTVVKLTAKPRNEYDFTGWTGDAIGTSGMAGTVTMTGNKEIGATFKEMTGVRQPTIVYEAGENPTIFDFTKEITFKSATPDVKFTYIITAQPGTSGVSGTIEGKSDGDGSVSKTGINLNDVGAAGKYIVWVVAEKGGETSNSASLTFTKKLTLTVNTPVNGSIQVNNVVTSGAYDVAYGTVLMVKATPNSGYSFTSWTGVDDGYTTLATAYVTMDKDKNIVATFTQQWTLNVTATAGGSVRVTTPTINDTTSSASYKVDHGTLVTLTATAYDDYEFTGWSGSYTSSSNSLRFAMNSSRGLTATFVKKILVGDGPGGGWKFQVGNKWYEVTEVLGRKETSWGNAIAVAKSHQGGGFMNWGLPNKELLNEIWLAKTTLEGKSFPVYTAYWFWSSSQHTDDFAWIQGFSDGRLDYSIKTTHRHLYVLAVRAFNP